MVPAAMAIIIPAFHPLTVKTRIRTRVMVNSPTSPFITSPRARKPEPEPEQPKKKSGSGLLAAVALLVLAGGGAFAYVKFIKPNRSGVKVSADPDEYDFPDEEYINEDEPEPEEEMEDTK